jgi:hypothetical protein
MSRFVMVLPCKSSCARTSNGLVPTMVALVLYADYVMHEIAMRRVADLELHPLVNLVPSMQPREFDDVRDDIKAHGIQVPLDIAGNTVLDGRHRLMIARELSLRTVPCRTVSLNGESPIVYMLKMALLRRHLTDDQRAATAALWKQRQARGPGRPQKNSHNGVEVPKVPATVAPTVFNVARRKVDEATFLMHRSPRRLTAVHEGRLKLKDALRDLAIEQQRKNVARLKAPRGLFSVIVVDPPWPYDNGDDDLRKRGAIPYPAMSIAEIQAATLHRLSMYWHSRQSRSKRRVSVRQRPGTGHNGSDGCGRWLVGGYG